MTMKSCREGIRTLLSKARPDWEMVGVGEAGNAEQAMEAVGRLNPDLVVLDLTMPGTSGLEVAPKIRKIKLERRILMFTMHESDELEAKVRDASAQGHVLKSQGARDLVVAIETLLHGRTFFGAAGFHQGAGL